MNTFFRPFPLNLSADWKTTTSPSMELFIQLSPPSSPRLGTPDKTYVRRNHSLCSSIHFLQIIYLPDLSGAKGAHKLTTGSQGATRNPVFARKSAKLAWLELPQDGYESDRYPISMSEILSILDSKHLELRSFFTI